MKPLPPMSYDDRRRLQEAVVAPCQLACDQGHMDAAFAALASAFAALVVASGLPVERALTLHNEQVHVLIAEIRTALGAPQN